MSVRWSPLFAAVLLLAFLPLPASASAPDSGALCDQLAGNADDPDLPGAPGVKGVIWENVEAAAEAACRRAIAEHPGERRYVFQLGRAIDSSGDPAGAVPFYQRAADAGSAVSYNSLGLLYEAGDGVAQDYARAAELYQKAVDRGLGIAFGNLALLYAGGHIPGKTGTDAVALYEKEIALGDDGWGAMDLGNLYDLGRGVPKDLKRAEQLFRQAIASKNPQVSATASNALAWQLVQNGGDLAEAERLSNQSIARERQDDPWSKAVYLDTRALILHRTGRDMAAVADAETAIKFLPEDAAVHDRLGDIYAALGRRTEAIAVWEKALALDPPGPLYEPQFDPDTIRKKIAGARSI